MPKTVEFPELGAVDFPDEMSWDEVQQTIESNKQSIHQSLFDRRAKQMAAETNAESEPPGIADAYVQTIRSIGKGAISGVSGLSKAIGEGAAFINRKVYNGGEPGTWASGNPADLATYKFGKGLQDAAEEASPDIPGLEGSFWFNDVPSGIGQVGGALATGGGAGALVEGGAAKLGVQGAAKLGTQAAVRLGLTEMAGAEFDDAYQRSIDRGDTPDMATGKATAYGVLATAIEAKLGLGRIAKRFGFGQPMKEMEAAAKHGLARVALTEAAAGFTEEALQRAAQDYIVDGELDVNAIAREGGAGAVVQALLGAVGHHRGRKTAQAALDWVAKAQADGITKAQQKESGFTDETLKELGIHVLEADAPAGSGDNIIIKELPNLNPPAKSAQPVVKDSLITGQSATPTEGAPATDTQAGVSSNSAEVDENAAVAPEKPRTPPHNLALNAQTPQVADENPIAMPEKDSGSVAEEPSLTRRVVKKIVSRVASALPGLPKIVITRDNTEWPAELQDQFGGKSPRAAFHQGTIYMASNEFESPKEVQGAVLHEGVGHYGIRFVLRDAFDGFMEAVYRAHKDTELGRQIQATYEFDHENPDDQIHFAEEVVAHLAENPKLDPTLWKRVVEAVKTGWRKMTGGAVSEDEIHRVVRKAYRQLQTRSDIGGASRFSLRSPKVKLPALDVAPAEFEGGRAVVSTRVPTSVYAGPSMEVLHTDMAGIDADPEYRGKVAAVVRQYPHMTTEQKKLRNDQKVIREFIDLVKENLRFLHDAFPENVRMRAKLWYDGAKRISMQIADQYGLTDEQAAGVLAVLSPQMDWYKNVSMAWRVVDIVRRAERENPVFTDARFEHYKAKVKSSIDAKVKELLNEKGAKTAAEYKANKQAQLDADADDFIGKSWSQLTLEGRARLLRVIDEVEGERSYPIITPEGHTAGIDRKIDGTPKSLGWGSYKTIGNAIQIVQDGRIENISRVLGNEHKVRNFFNNISHPNSARGFVTIDTHAVAAALLEPLSGKSAEVKHSLGGAGSSATSGMSGMSGTYGVYAQAYIELANELGIKPRELQSITWEAVRQLFKPEQKRSDLPKKTKALWKSYQKGTLSADELRKQLTAVAGGIGSPNWQSGEDGMATEQGQLPVGDVQSGGPGVSAGRRSGSGNPPSPTRPRPSRPDGIARALTTRFSIEGERQHGEKLKATDKLDDPIKDRITNWLYQRRDNASDAAFATSMVHDMGIEEASNAFRDDRNGLPEAVRTMLGHAIVTAYGQLERDLRMKGQISNAEQAATAVAQFIDNDVLPRSTSIAQALQAFKAFMQLTPAGWLATGRRMVEKARGNQLVNAEPHLATALEQMRRVNEAVVDQVGSSPAVQAAAGTALDASVEQAPEIEWVVREQAAAKFPGLKELISDHFSGRNPGKTLTQKLQAVYGLDAKRAARKAAAIEKVWKREVERYKGQVRARLRDERGLWKRYKEGIAGQVVSLVRSTLRGPDRQAALVGFSDRVAAVLRKHVEARLPVTPSTPTPKLSPAKIIGEALNNPEKYQDAWLEAVDALRNEFAGQPAVLQRLEDAMRQRPDLIASGPLEKAVSKKFQEMRGNMGKVVRSHFLDQSAAGRTLADRLVQEAGVSGDAAVQLAAAVQNKFRQLATARKTAELAKLAKQGAGVLARKGVAQRIIELSNLGAFENRPAMEAVAERMGLPSFTPEAAKEIQRMATELQTLPKDSHMQKAATIKMMSYIARQEGLRWWDLPLAFWYANTLAGPVTHLVNAGSNLLSMGGNLATTLARRPTDVLTALSAAADGFRKGLPEAQEILKTGIQVRRSKLDAVGTLERVLPGDYKGAGVVINKWKYVGRALAAADQLFFFGNREVRAAVMARATARREGLTGAALQARARVLLGATPEIRAAAEAQATAEGVTGLDYARRVNELMDAARPSALAEDAEQWALRATFNNKPYGLLGVIAEGINLINRKAVVTRAVIPFVDVVANVTNESLNYSPIGAGRAAWAHWNIHRGSAATLYGGEISDKELIYDAYAKAAIGTAMVAALVSIAAKGMDDDDYWFAMSGQGPANADRKKGLRETGWIPYSIRVNGTYYNYANTPMAVPLAIAGNYLDALKYGNLAQSDALTRVAFAVGTAGHVITQQSFLDSLARLMGALDHVSDKTAGDRATDVVARAMTTVVVPQALRQVDRMFDPRVMQPLDVKERVMAQIPFVRRGLKPALNALGEPVRSEPLDRIVSGMRHDELWTELSRVGAVPSMPEQGMLTADEHYDLVEYRASILRPKLEAALGRITSSTPAEARRIVNGITSEATATSKKALGLTAVEAQRKAEAQ